MSSSSAPVYDHSEYQTPLSTRYASKEMRYNFSDQNKFSTWRKLWVYLAKAERIICFIGTCLDITTKMTLQAWSIQGWSVISLALIIACIFEDPNVWLQVILLVTFTVVSLVGAFMYNVTVRVFLLPVLVGAIMIADLIYLIKNELQSETESE